MSYDNINIIMVFIFVFLYIANGLLSTSINILSIINVYLLIIAWRILKPWAFAVVMLLIMRLYI